MAVLLMVLANPAETLGGAPAPAPTTPDSAGAAVSDSAGAAVSDSAGAAVGSARRGADRRGGFFRSPTGIMLRSLVVPGWGQATNRAWVKAGVVAVGEGALLVSIARDTARLGDLAPGELEYSLLFDRRQQKVWWLGAAVFVAMIDAYVDAHLRSGGIEIGPEPTGDGLALAARVRWP